MDTLRRSLLLSPLSLAASGAAGTAFAQTPAPDGGKPITGWPKPSTTIDLWPHGVSGQLHADMQEIVEETSTDPAVHFRRTKGVSKPRLAVFPAAKPNGSAMLVIPGGGFAWNYFDHEGYQLAERLNREGVTAFVLFYRLAQDGWANPADVALADTQRAMRVIRHVAPTFALDAKRVGVAGFSAGGFLTASILTRSDANFYAAGDAADALDARPFLAAPIYPVQSLDPAVAYDGAAPSLFGGPASPAQIAAYSPDQNVKPGLPPCFLVHAEDDKTVPVANTTRLRDALHGAGNVVETHLFAAGGHGFGMKPDTWAPYHVWPDLLVAFARSQGLFG